VPDFCPFGFSMKKLNDGLSQPALLKKSTNGYEEPLRDQV